MRALLSRETDRRLASVDRALDGALTRAGVVIAGALVIAGIPAGYDVRHWSPLVGVGLAITGAILSVLPRRIPEVPVARLYAAIPRRSLDSMSDEVLEDKLTLLRHSESGYRAKTRQLVLSYAALALALVGLVYANF